MFSQKEERRYEIEQFIQENPDVLEPGETIFEEDDSITAWQTPVTVGAQFALGSNVSINALARDYILFANGTGKETSSNFYFGAGVFLLF